MLSIRRKCLQRALLLLCLCPASGCHDGRLRAWPVTGHIQFADGEPVKTGIIELESLEHGTTATGKIGPEGEFVLGTYQSADGAVAGEHRVIVLQLIMGDGSIRHTLDHGRPVPVTYAAYETSPLRVQIEPRRNQITIHLQETP